MTRCIGCGRTLGIRDRVRGKKVCTNCPGLARDLQLMADDISRQLGVAPTPMTMDDARREASIPREDELELPEYPGERDPDCTCSWEINETATEYVAFWRLDDDAPCTNARCRRNAVKWNPFVQLKAGHQVKSPGK